MCAWRFIVFALVALVAAGSLRAQGAPRYFFCYAPDPASGTVFMSSALPVGPVAERAGYGEEFVTYLKKLGKLRADVRGYCNMQPTVEAVARSQALLPKENCPECGGASRYEGVAWARGGKASAPPPSSTKLAAHTRPAAAGAMEKKPFLLVMGNTRTGKLIVLSNRPTRAAAETVQARFPAATGWKTLLLSSEDGYGAAVCVREGGETRFFVAHAQNSFEDAARVAREFALQNELNPERMELCGAPWDVRRGVDASQSDEAVFEAIKRWMRKQLTCDPQRKDCPGNSKTGEIGEMGARG